MPCGTCHRHRFVRFGKIQSGRRLEDIGFFCVDNIPPKLILKFAELCSQSAQAMDRVAIVVDARSREMFSTFSESLAELTARGYTYKILYIEAEDSVILKRYKETRRRHPLLDGSATAPRKPSRVSGAAPLCQGER